MSRIFDFSPACKRFFTNVAVWYYHIWMKWPKKNDVSVYFIRAMVKMYSDLPPNWVQWRGKSQKAGVRSLKKLSYIFQWASANCAAQILLDGNHWDISRARFRLYSMANRPSLTTHLKLARSADIWVAAPFFPVSPLFGWNIARERSHRWPIVERVHQKYTFLWATNNFASTGSRSMQETVEYCR